MRITVFLGAPGSGKGTQAKKLCQENIFVHLSTGDMLRSAIKDGTALGKEAKTFMDKGELVPDSTVIGLIRETLAQLKSNQHVILDGFPRTVAQAEALNGNPSTQVNQAVLFEIPDSILIERLTGRRVCKQCGQPFHAKYIPPKKEGVCDSCGGEVIQRSDDNEDV
ncbi:MAG: adenylate kinase family protein, partial [Pseudomonadota bacterium]